MDQEFHFVRTKIGASTTRRIGKSARLTIKAEFSSGKGWKSMRQFIITLSAFGLLSSVVGCHHTAGVCDCDKGMRDPCGYLHHKITPAPEPIKEMPKE